MRWVTLAGEPPEDGEVGYIEPGEPPVDGEMGYAEPGEPPEDGETVTLSRRTS